MDAFDRDLEGVFEHRAGDFSSQLRELLRKLWLEGVREGRTLERLDAHDLERRVAELERPAAREPGSNITVTSSSQVRELRPEEFTLEMITEAVARLQAEFPSVRQLEPRFGMGRWLEEAADPSPWRSNAEVESALENVRQLSRREMLGTWEDDE